jgi:hypothetical protein
MACPTHSRLGAVNGVVGTVLGLLTHSPKLVLTEGSVPTVVFGIACLGWHQWETPAGRTYMQEPWRYPLDRTPAAETGPSRLSGAAWYLSGNLR